MSNNVGWHHVLATNLWGLGWTNKDGLKTDCKATRQEMTLPTEPYWTGHETIQHEWRSWDFDLFSAEGESHAAQKTYVYLCCWSFWNLSLQKNGLAGCSTTPRPSTPCSYQSWYPRSYLGHERLQSRRRTLAVALSSNMWNIISSCWEN